MIPSPDVIVVGAGVAGISAAVHLATHGKKVTLIEQRHLPGGRAGSIPSRFSHQTLIDRCQHVLLGCCTELQSLYKTLGVSDLIRFDDSIHFADSRARRATLRAAPLPSPLHLAPSMLLFPWLSLASKAQIALAMGRILLSRAPSNHTLSDTPFLDLLRSWGQSPATIRDYWDVITISALNETCADVSAKYGIQVFQESFLSKRDGYRLGYAIAPLSGLYNHLPGIQTKLGQSVHSLELADGRIAGVMTSHHERLTASHVILATDPRNALALLKPLHDRDEQFSRMQRLTYRPILGAHLLYDRPIPLPHPVALIGTKLHWVFPDPTRNDLLHGVVSAADLLDPHDDLPAIFDLEIRQTLNCLGEARLVDSLIVKENRATFRPIPGVDTLRPTQQTAVPGLLLAGDYTRTNWPATMEGAARSGHLAAQAIFQS